MEVCLLTDEFKKRIKRRRMELGATQKDVARYFSVKVPTYWYWENGVTRKCSDASAQRLRHFVDTDISLIRAELKSVDMNKNDFYDLEDCLKVVSQVCNMVHGNKDVLDDYAQKVQGILTEAFAKHISEMK
ncbi:MAG: helix-turn-helix transcriptional regulator [Victivallales bacterium]|nr:helix-turn-helix transcriptional regulator [Victivallales bacterium]